MRKITTRTVLRLVTLCLILLAGCKKEDFQSTPAVPADRTYRANTLSDQQFNYSSDVSTKWFDLELQLIKTTEGFTPPVASRALGYTGVTLYESIVARMKNYTSLREKMGYSYSLPTINSDANLYWPAVANAALRYIVSNLYPTTNSANKQLIAVLFLQLHNQYVLESSPLSVANSELYGAAVASAIFDWSKTDGGHAAYANNTPSYTLPSTAGTWVPTYPAYQPTPVQAYWGSNRPFVAQSLDPNSLPAAPPYPFSTVSGSGFYNQAKEVYEINLHLTSEQKAIANFWSDGGGTVTPPGHSMNIATQMIKATGKNLGEAAIVYARLGMAVADAFIACWRGKYKYNLMRPISYIRQYIDPNWTSFLVTPAFPTYCSGHATVSAASAEILSSLFGPKTKFVDKTNEQTLGTREFNSFEDAALEASVSRLYGGIHFRMDNEIGFEKGKIIGKNIAEIKLKN